MRLVKRMLAFILAAIFMLVAAGCAPKSDNKVTEGPSGEITDGDDGPDGDADDEPPPDTRTVRTIADTDDVLLNPGKGFVYYGGSWETTKKVRDYVSIGYHRYSWCDIEPADGEYNFDKIKDDIDFYAGIGKKFAFGVMFVNTSSSKPYITPKWVFDKGAGYDISHRSDGIERYIPKWRDEKFLAEAKKFIAALGSEFNDNENVAFIDILSYGNWGEQHLFGLDVDSPEYERYEYDARPDPQFIEDNYIRPYMDAFPDKLLVNPWGYEDLDPMYLSLFDEGVTVRRDGICKYTNGLDTLAAAYGKLPVIFEYAGNYKDNVAEGPESEAEFNRMLEEAI